MAESIKGILFEMSSSFGVGYPKDIPFAEGITLDGLKEIDPDPVFLTLPIGAVNAVSRNNRRYNRAAVEAIRDAVLVKRVGGILGHLRDADRPYDYQTSAIHWVGAVIENGTLWAKGYIPKTEVKLREEVRIAKMKRGLMGTSIYGTAEIDDEGNVSNLDVESIDIAHPDRVGILAAAAVPAVTKETTDHGAAIVPVFEGAEFGARVRRAIDQRVENHPRWEEIMARMADAAGITLDQLFSVLHSTETASIPDEQLQAWATILNISLDELRQLAGVKIGESKQSGEDKPMSETKPEGQVMVDGAELERRHRDEIRQFEAKLAENRADLKDLQSIKELLKNPRDAISAVRVLQQTIEDLQRENGDLLQETIRLKVEEAVKVPAARLLIINMVTAEKPVTRCNVETALEAVLKRDDVKQMLRAGTAQEMGPKLENSAQPVAEAEDPALADLRIVIPGVN